MTRIAWFGLLPLLCCSTSITSLAQETKSFQYSRPIAVDGTTNEEIFSAPLDSDVFAATRDGFPDLRVFDNNHRLVPFLVQNVTKDQVRKVRKFSAAENPAVHPQENGGMEIRLRLQKEDPSASGIRFVTPLENFEQQVQVFAIIDGAETSLVHDARIYDYRQFMDVRQTELEFPATTAREFRIVVNALTTEQDSRLLELSRTLKDGTEEARRETTMIERRPFRIDRIEFLNEQAEVTERSGSIQTWPVADLKVTEDVEKQQTIVEVTSRREPLTTLKLMTNSLNFSRKAAVQVLRNSEVESKWEAVSEATLSRFSIRDFHEEHLVISMPETRGESYRIVIENGDSPALTIESVEASGHQYELIFLRAGSDSVRLEYGSDTADAPQQDTVALTTVLNRKLIPISATLGKPSRSPVPSLTPLNPKSLLNNPILLGTIVALLVFVLGWGLYKAAGRIDMVSHGDE